MEINFFFEDIDEISLNKKYDIEWINLCIEKYEKKKGDLNFIFCSDSYLLNINKEYLNHDYYTDIVTFDYCQDDLISGDIFISVNRVEENAKKYEITFENELHRVIIHGILHLIGFKDSNKKEKEEMRKAENDCLNTYFKKNY